MNKDELRIRIIPEDGEILIETHTDGIVKCKAVQEDAFLDCIKISAMQDYVIEVLKRILGLSSFIHRA